MSSPESNSATRHLAKFNGGGSAAQCLLDRVEAVVPVRGSVNLCTSDNEGSAELCTQHPLPGSLPARAVALIKYR